MVAAVAVVFALIVVRSSLSSLSSSRLLVFVLRVIVHLFLVLASSLSSSSSFSCSYSSASPSPSSSPSFCRFRRPFRRRGSRFFARAVVRPRFRRLASSRSRFVVAIVVIVTFHCVSSSPSSFRHVSSSDEDDVSR